MFKALSRNKAEYGNAILTRFIPKKVKEWELGKSLNSDGENRVAISVEYCLNNNRNYINFCVINVHFGLSKEDQCHQLKRLKDIINTTSAKKPIFLCGDFNIIERDSTAFKN